MSRGEQEKHRHIKSMAVEWLFFHYRNFVNAVMEKAVDDFL